MGLGLRIQGLSSGRVSVVDLLNISEELLFFDVLEGPCSILQGRQEHKNDEYALRLRSKDSAKPCLGSPIKF